MTQRGMVTSVTIDEEEGRVYVSVVVGPNKTYREILYTPAAPGVWVVPEEKDIIEVYERASGRYAARNPEHQDAFFPSGLAQGDVVFVADDGTGVRMERNADGTNDIAVESGSTDAAITIDGSTGEITIQGSNVTIDGIDFDQHTHTYDDSTINDTGDGSGTESTTSKTTDPPQ